MQLSVRRISAIAATLLALATLMGALAAHVLSGRLAPRRYEVLQIAVQYQFFHSLGLLALALLQDRLALRALGAAAWLLTAGIVLFSGSLYLLALGAPGVVGIATPLGGLGLIGSWAWVAIALLRSRAIR